MLLVDDGDSEVVELRAFLDQRVRADDDLRVADAGSRVARQQRGADAERDADRVDRQEVLLGERLGRGHQRAAVPVLDRAQQRVERDHRLARADVALEQALHRHAPGEVVIELGDRALLMLGERERQRGAVALDQLAGRAELGRLRVLAVSARERKRELQLEELVEREPPPSALGVLLGLRPVDRDERVAHDRELEPRAQHRGQQVADVVRVRQRRLHERAQPLRGHVLARRIDRREVCGLRRLAEVVALDDEVVAAALTA